MSEQSFVAVRDVMTPNPLVIDGLATVDQAVELLRKHGFSSLVIDRRDEGDEYGLLAVHDIAEKIVSQGRAPERVNVYEIMAKPVVSVRPEMDIRYCARLFESMGISEAPVIERGEVIGIVTYYLLVLEGLQDFDD